MTNINVELDIAWDYYATPSFHIDLEKHNVEYTLIELEGPAGGNPLVRFTAPRQNIISLMTEWQYDEDDIDLYLE
jgi:hypothetical protein